jgi:hypothetical protein
LPADVAKETGQRHERKVDRVQHQLYAQEYRYGIALYEHPDRPDREKQAESPRYHDNGTR